MDRDELIETLRAQPFLEGLKTHHLEELASMVIETRFEKDRMIFREGDESSFFYLLLSGKVALEIVSPTQTVRVQTLSGGDELGWSSVLAHGGKNFQARVLETVQALAFDSVHLRDEFSKNCELGYAFLARLLKVVESRVQATRLQLLDLYAPRTTRTVLK